MLRLLIAIRLPDQGFHLPFGTITFIIGTVLLFLGLKLFTKQFRLIIWNVRYGVIVFCLGLLIMSILGMIYSWYVPFPTFLAHWYGVILLFLLMFILGEVCIAKAKRGASRTLFILCPFFAASITMFVWSFQIWSVVPHIQ